MKAVIFTGNSIRHKYVANTIVEKVDNLLVVSECKKSDAPEALDQPKSIREHFKLRFDTEKIFFTNNDVFYAKTLPILYKELSSQYIYNVVKKFKPDFAFIFGSSIIKEPLLSLLPDNFSINLHLGLSPYYRGSGTNFWPFVNKEIEYVGATLLHINKGIDTGDIIAHVLPKIEVGDNAHTTGCKVIKESAKCLVNVLSSVKVGKKLNRTKQWKVDNERYYRDNDFNEEILNTYIHNLKSGLIKKYISNPKKIKKLVLF